MGLIEDSEGNIVAFSGSMNESATAMSINYETIDVFRSWGGANEAERVKLKESAFYSIWNDCEPNIHVLEFPSISKTLIENTSGLLLILMWIMNSFLIKYIGHLKALKILQVQ